MSNYQIINHRICYVHEASNYNGQLKKINRLWHSFSTTFISITMLILSPIYSGRCLSGDLDITLLIKKYICSPLQPIITIFIIITLSIRITKHFWKKRTHHCIHHLDLSLQFYNNETVVFYYEKGDNNNDSHYADMESRPIKFQKTTYIGDNNRSLAILKTTQTLLLNFSVNNNESIIHNYKTVIALHKNCNEICLNNLIRFMITYKENKNMYLLLWLIYVHLEGKECMIEEIDFSDPVYRKYVLTNEIRDASKEKVKCYIKNDPLRYFTKNQLLMIYVLSDNEKINELICTKNNR